MSYSFDIYTRSAEWNHFISETSCCDTKPGRLSEHTTQYAWCTWRFVYILIQQYRRIHFYTILFMPFVVFSTILPYFAYYILYVLQPPCTIHFGLCICLMLCNNPNDIVVYTKIMFCRFKTRMFLPIQRIKDNITTVSCYFCFNSGFVNLPFSLCTRRASSHKTIEEEFML